MLADRFGELGRAQFAAEVARRFAVGDASPHTFFDECAEAAEAGVGQQHAKGQQRYPQKVIFLLAYLKKKAIMIMTFHCLLLSLPAL